MTDTSLDNTQDGDRDRRPDGDSQAAARLRRDNRSMALQLTLFAAAFLAFGFALVPLYDVICDVTGYGSRKNLTQASTPGSAQASEQPQGREITVEFISTMPTVGEWEFRPVEKSAKVRTGQLFSAKFVAKNLLAFPATGQAVPSIAPHEAGPFFRKTECFCFTPQHFDALQERELTVRFVVDSRLPNSVDRITLAYSMYGVSQKVAAR